MEEFVGTTQAHGFRLIPQVPDGVFQAFLPLSLLGVEVGSRLLLRCNFHRFGAPVGYYSPNGKKDPAHTDAQEFQNLEFFGYPKEIESPHGIFGDHDNHEQDQQDHRVR